MRYVLNRLPPRVELFPVFSLLVLWQFSWAVFVFLYNLPSWLLAIPLWDITGFLSYGLMFALLDSILIFSLALLLVIVLPASWLRDDFSVSGGMFISLLFFWILFFQFVVGELMNWPGTYTFAILGLAIFSTAVFTWAARRLKLIRRFILWLGSSAELFAYLYIGLSLISIVIVLIRNLF